MKSSILLVASIGLCALVLISQRACAQGTAFTYQGQLNDTGQPASGIYDLRFTIYDSTNLPGSVIAGPLTNAATSVSSGLFTVLLDFGPAVFTGPARWLQIDVRTNGGTTFAALSPRQNLTPSPYAIFANSSSNLSGALPAGQLSGAVTNGQLANSSITVNAGAGLSGGGTVALGGSATLNNTGVLSVTGNADITASTVGGAVTLGDTATSANTPSTIVKRDGNGSFSAGSLALSGTLNLPAAPVTINSGSSLLLRTDGNQNFFAGESAGNSTLTGTYNSGIGYFALKSNTSGNYNTATGVRALTANTIGWYNTANGTLALTANTNGLWNTANGYYALGYNTSGNNNTANGALALLQNTSGNDNTANGYSALGSSTTGDQNTANGSRALNANTNGFGNTANGSQALQNNTSGSYNTADGFSALALNTTGSNNIAVGFRAGQNITTGSFNIHIGNQGLSTDDNTIRIGSGQSQTFIAGVLSGNGAGLTSLNVSASQLTSIGNTNGSASDNFFIGPSGNSTTSGSANTANGFFALGNNTSGFDNTANGVSALGNNTSGTDNTANGASALISNTNGSDNTANGFQALFYSTSGYANTANGAQALFYNTIGSDNTADGDDALFFNTSGSHNIALGYASGYNITTGSYNIDIGNQGFSTDANTIRIGSAQTSAFVSGIYGTPISGGSVVGVNSSGQLGTAFSESNVALLNGNQIFTGADTFNDSLTLNGNLNLPATTASAGIIYSGGGTLMHAFGSQNFFAGPAAGNLTMSGTYNTGVGRRALVQNTSGGFNTATGEEALSSNTNGQFNTANGVYTLALNTSGSYNTAAGETALENNTTGSYNTANGAAALASSINGDYNTASGYEALFFNTSGSYNTAAGVYALENNTVGSYNTANGFGALSGSTNGQFNTASGYLSLLSNTSGNHNTANGGYALENNSSGSDNISLGYLAGYNLTTGSSNIDIGNQGLSTDANLIRIGSGQTQTFLAGIYGTAVSGGSVVGVNSSGQLGTAFSESNVALLNGSQAFSGANTFNGTVTLDNTVQAFANVFLNDHDLQFRGDAFHGVGWYGLGKLFGTLSADGPALYGFTGGVLGTKHGSVTNAALQWDYTGRLNVDPLGVNSGALLPGITFGSGGSGEGISSQRTGAIGLNGLDFYTGNTLRMRILNNGNVGIGTNNPAALLQVGSATCNGTSWNNASDRNAKENFRAIEPGEVLEQVKNLPITRWNYKAEGKGVAHLGPMAQDFYQAFNIGTDDKHIATVDEGGVALAAIQGLNQKVEELKGELNRRDSENAALAQQINELKGVVNLLSQKLNAARP